MSDFSETSNLSTHTIKTPSIENSALAAGSVGTHGTKEDRKNVGSVWCDYCNMVGHTCETCWKGSHEGKYTKISFANEVETSPFSQEQINYIQKLLMPKSESFNAPNTSIAITGSDPSVFSCSISTTTPWIIDSGASDHMTSFSIFFFIPIILVLVIKRYGTYSRWIFFIYRW